MEKYKIIKEIGSGSFSNVIKAERISDGMIVAIKKMKQKYTSWDECMELKEIKSLRKLSHPNLVKLFEVIRVNDELSFVFEHCECNLLDFYQLFKNKQQAIPLETIKRLAYMHQNGFFHRDMKPENILFKTDKQVKICDFGLAREIRAKPPFTEYISTRWAPELILSSTTYNSPIDIFALGCIFAELLMLEPLFCGASPLDQINKICQILGTPTQNEWPQGYALAAQNGFKIPKCQQQNLKSIINDASEEALELLQQMLYEILQNVQQQNKFVVNHFLSLFIIIIKQIYSEQQQQEKIICTKNQQSRQSHRQQIKEINSFSEGLKDSQCLKTITKQLPTCYKNKQRQQSLISIKQQTDYNDAELELDDDTKIPKNSKLKSLNKTEQNKYFNNIDLKQMLRKIRKNNQYYKPISSNEISCLYANNNKNENTEKVGISQGLQRIYSQQLNFYQNSKNNDPSMEQKAFSKSEFAILKNNICTNNEKVNQKGNGLPTIQQDYEELKPNLYTRSQFPKSLRMQTNQKSILDKQFQNIIQNQNQNTSAITYAESQKQNNEINPYGQNIPNRVAFMKSQQPDKPIKIQRNDFLPQNYYQPNYKISKMLETFNKDQRNQENKYRESTITNIIGKQYF